MRMILAVAVLCGIGFTMSIFISTLAFPAEQSVMVDYTKIGILIGSSASALLGFSMLSRALPSVVAQEVPASSLTNTKLQQSRLE